MVKSKGLQFVLAVVIVPESEEVVVIIILTRDVFSIVHLVFETSWLIVESVVSSEFSIDRVRN